MSSAWVPRLVALDIDGTLLSWVEDTGAPHPVVSAPVVDAVRRAREAGAEIVLASGRSPHGMTAMAESLDLHELAEQAWIVASNGAVVFRYPPIDIVLEETFDAAPAVRAVLAGPTDRAGRGRGAGHRLPGVARVPGGRADRRDDPDRRRRHRRRAGEPGDHPRPRGDGRGLHRDGPRARPAPHRLRRRLDRLARPRAAGGVQGVRARLRRGAARADRGRRAGDRRRPQRHRDARVGRPRRRDGPVGAAGAGRGRRGDGDGRRGRRRDRARRYF